MVYPGPYALEAIQRKPAARYFNLSELPKLKVCAWCNAFPVHPPKRRYCSDDCQRSAHMFCTPQSPAMKMYILLQLQDCTCVGCGEFFEDHVNELVDKWWALIQERRKHGIWTEKELDKVPLRFVGDQTGHLWHVDHIIPIFRGGHGVCLENLQVLCVNCHRVKTARERRTA